MRGLRQGASQLLGISIGLMFLGSTAVRSSIGPFTFLGEQKQHSTSKDVTLAPMTSPMSQSPEGSTNHLEGTHYDNNTTHTSMNLTEAGNATIVEETDAEKIQGRLGPHNTPMGTPSHSKGIAFIDDEKEHYKCYSCKGKACELTQTSDSRMCNTTRRTCWMTFTMANGMVTRGCSSPHRSIKCTQTYPNGFITDGQCSFCCTDNLCNWHVLMNSTCVGINAESSAPSTIPIVPACLLAIVFTLFKFSN